ncbi:MAG: FumA C-terminus/TtdB family hydratase beta subunit [Actinomycetota bacterium]|nr:FumA C-terminus/TtdB family hydratase beta subunit [Actinomycetota bacterium]
MRELKIPPSRLELETLKAGDELVLSGPSITLRDAALRRAGEFVSQRIKLPFSVSGEVIFHASPTPPKIDRACGAIGPTTAARMDSFLPLIFELGAFATLGKGPRGHESLELHRKFRAVYFVTIGGIGALLGQRVSGIETIAWEDLGPEAVKRVFFEEFPVVVAIDSHGNDHLEEIYDAYRTSGSGIS